MGFGVPGGIAAKLRHPGRQVFNVCRDGAFAMAMQDIVAQVRYGLPVINVVFSNNSLGFIEVEQEDAGQEFFGVQRIPVDFVKAGEAMGARGFTVTRRDEIRQVVDQAGSSEVPVVIDVKIANTCPFPAEAMIPDKDIYSDQEIAAFRKRYQAPDMTLLKELL